MLFYSNDICLIYFSHMKVIYRFIRTTLSVIEKKKQSSIPYLKPTIDYVSVACVEWQCNFYETQ